MGHEGVRIAKARPGKLMCQTVNLQMKHTFAVISNQIGSRPLFQSRAPTANKEVALFYDIVQGLRSIIFFSDCNMTLLKGAPLYRRTVAGFIVPNNNRQYVTSHQDPSPNSFGLKTFFLPGRTTKS